MLERRSFDFDRWLWLCPLLGLAIAALALFLYGFSFWAALLLACVIGCAALLIWGAILALRRTP